MRGHLTLEERDRVAQLMERGFNQSEIAKQIGRSQGTISRELARNKTGGEYLAGQAQRMADVRRAERPLERKTERPEVAYLITLGLIKRWSPEQIAGRMRQERGNHPELWVSPQTIYTWVQGQGERRAHWQGFLRRRGKRRRENSGNSGESCKNRIENRPQVVEQRKRLGDFEGDTVLGPPGTGGLATVVDRKSRYTIMTKVANKEAEHVRQKITQRLAQIDQDRRHTITFDNGTEFAQADQLGRKLNMDIYYGKPGTPQHRGTNENTNGLIRQFFPKGTDFRNISHHQVKDAENLLNNRPRACLGYRTPNEVFNGTSDELLCA